MKRTVIGVTHRIRPNQISFVRPLMLAGAILGSIELGPCCLDELAFGPQPARAANEQKRWETAAPGRVESASREIKVSAAILAPIAEVVARINDKVSAGDLLVRLDDRDALARLRLAEAQVEDRRRARDDAPQPAGEQVKLADSVAASERAVAAARSRLDRLVIAGRAGGGSETNLAEARSALTRAQEQFQQEREALQKLRAAPDAPLPSRTETALAVARAEWTIAQEALERTRIRAPIAGTILQVHAKVGEMAGPSSEPLVILGDRSALRVRAEVDERDIGKIAIGQRVVVRADAFRGRDFDGKVSAIAPIVGPGRISQRGPQKSTDTEVMEVLIDLSEASLLVVGLRVDVFFTSERADR
jgi:HlyD family secretion protein